MSTFERGNCTSSVLACLLLSVIYVASLYVWRLNHLNRDHPSVIKRRFSVFIIGLLSPITLYLGINEQFYPEASYWQLLGLRWSGLLQAIVIPTCLTMILFLGPLYMQGVNGLWQMYMEPAYWLSNMKTLIWWRNHVVAPLSEEWTFRACMLPLLLQCFQPKTAIFICPLFFGVAHFHHFVENMRRGMELKIAVFSSCFQFTYTTVFGAYASYLFARTGHFAAPFAAHAFCNHMGFPDVSEIFVYEDSMKRAKIMSVFVLGLAAWCFLLGPMTNPSWFNNAILWKSEISAVA
ncbi:unnamed protein product [Trichogramma brassicae]|uniref:CAAX prenyl protease 2 n=1 Tax=Trichogramma brassicae TaxID=86971 RepID=A0A6H5HUA8_9HYME|nr:unnamed protein product [Trichogramma brassicae]